MHSNLHFKRVPLIRSQTVRFGDNGDNVDNLAELLHNNYINRAEGVASRVDEVEAAVDSRVLDVSVSHSGELLAEVSTVLVLNVFDDRVPATT